ncbi:MAG: thioredoxin domain-containing protein [Ruminiclostridium sp.]|jgi:uncharacterized protein YyaL (SSP411 family)|nr:thioredoxin domain-containing protein [Ruminiclostridium sp.]
MNHLQGQTSPYLLQHAENPVDWYPWGPEALERAQAEDKPIFLSIGYSTCHWCHVMARESFADPAVAALLNESFISIKVDREERPDIDSIYMAVCQAFTGGGGWPTTVFLTPEQKPFFAGTYFPKDGRPGQLGLTQLLVAIRDAWQHDREGLLAPAEQVTALLGRLAAPVDAAPEGDVLFQALRQWKASFDKEHGGFGRAPKFPMGHSLLCLLAFYEKTGDQDALAMAEKTLEQLFRGGIFDHVGGGFSRYSTDAQFCIPHFEKMLYDNALLILAYCKAYSLTKRALYREVALRTASYVLKELALSSGGFAAGQDADGPGGEGSFYAFRPQEVHRVLGSADAEPFCIRYHIIEPGNFHGASIPNLLGGALPEDRLSQSLAKLYAYRLARERLPLDDKVLTSWNGLMIAAMAWLYRITGEGLYLQAAERAWSCLDRDNREGNTLLVSSRDGVKGERGFLEDYTNAAFGLLALYEASGKSRYLDQAKSLCQTVFVHFPDREHGGFFLTDKDAPPLLIRPKELPDGALPSGNTMLAYVLLRLAQLTGEEAWQNAAQAQLDFLQPYAAQQPTAYPVYLWTKLAREHPPAEVTIVLGPQEKPPAHPWPFPLDAVVRILDQPAQGYDLLEAQTTYYVCENNTCRPGQVFPRA